MKKEITDILKNIVENAIKTVRGLETIKIEKCLWGYAMICYVKDDSEIQDTEYVLKDFLDINLSKHGDFDTEITEIEDKKVIIAYVYKKQIGDASDIGKLAYSELGKYTELDFFKGKRIPSFEKQFKSKKDSVYIGTDRFLNPLFLDLKNTILTGGTMSGKSVVIHNYIQSLMSKNNEKEIQFAIIDVKGGVEFGLYQKDKYFKDFPMACNIKEAVGLIGLIKKEIDRRKKILADLEKRDISKLDKETRLKENSPNIVLVIDEANEFLRQNKEVYEYLKENLFLFNCVGVFAVIGTQNLLDKDIFDLLFLSNFKLLFAGKDSSSVLKKEARLFHKEISDTNIRGFGDFLMIDDGKAKRIQSCYAKTKDIMENMNEYPYNKEEVKKKFIEGTKILLNTK